MSSGINKDKFFVRPPHIKEGVLLNTDNEALQSYKKIKNRFNKMKQLVEDNEKIKKDILDINVKLDTILELISRNNSQ